MSLASTIDSLSIAGTMYHFAAVGVESNRYINVATANSTTVVIYVTYSPATSSELVIFPNANSSAFSNYPFPNGMEGMAVKDSAIFYNQNISDESAIDLVAE